MRYTDHPATALDQNIIHNLLVATGGLLWHHAVCITTSDPAASTRLGAVDDSFILNTRLLASPLTAVSSTRVSTTAVETTAVETLQDGAKTV
jgi:hypothetical protein